MKDADMLESEWDAQATTYDLLNGDLREPDLDAINGMVTGNRVLELGCGTGRVALPVARSGRHVVALDYSSAMVGVLEEKLRAEPDLAIETVHAPMQDFEREASFDTILCVNNSLLFLPDQSTQVRALEKIRINLAPGGKAILQINAAASMLRTWGTDRKTLPAQIDSSGVATMSAIVDLERQRMQLVYERRSVDGTTDYVVPVTLRYIWADELALMCRLAGLRIVRSLGSWSGDSARGGSDLIVELAAGD